MDRFARKMILAALAFGSALLLMAGATSMIYFHYRPPCSEAAFAESKSPDGQWAADVMKRRCGDEAPFMIHVNLRRAGEHIQIGYLSGRAEQGEVFVIEEDASDSEPVLDWNAPGQLTIRCPGCAARVKMREEYWGPVAVRYQLSP